MKFRRFLALFLSQVLTVTAAFASAGVKFANPVVYGSGGQGTNFVVAADVNGDSFPDMIIANTDGVSVRLNNEDGTFAPAITYDTGGTNAFAVAVGDVNLDGIPDLVVTNMCTNSPGCSNGGVGVLIGNGDGTFKPAVSYGAGGIETQAVVIGDVNSDGWPDVTITSNCQGLTCVDGSIRLLLNQQDGTFQLTGTQISPSMGGPLAIGDLNGDGNLDLVADVGILLGNGDGTFTPLGSNPASDVTGGTISIALADVNNDSYLDVVVADQTSLKVLLGNGDGTLQSPLSFKTGGKRPLSVAVADFNGDGKLDMAVANECASITNGICSSTGSVGVLAGNGDGTFTQPPVIYTSSGRDATSVAVADADLDTRPDIFVSNVCTSSSNCARGDVGVLLNILKVGATVQVVSSINPALINQPFDVTATITSQVPIPDGSEVDFFSSGSLLGSGTTTSGVATVSGISFPTNGAHNITAKYAGDIYHNAGQATMTETVKRYPTTTTVISSLNPSNAGQNVTFTATVTSSGPSVPTGSIQFFQNGSLVGTVALSAGMANFSKTFTQSGTKTITASYLGDSQSALSSSAPLTQTVN
jgi:Bacterial Ig-like domain (group 3)/FG-GAP-like repeat